jgi:hypothetical protein
MARVVPVIAGAAVDLMVGEPKPAAPVKQIPEVRGVRLPHTLNLFAPAGFKNLIKIEANADINITRN